MMLKRFRFVLNHPELWDDPIGMIVALKKVSLYNRATTDQDLRVTVTRMIDVAKEWNADPPK